MIKSYDQFLNEAESKKVQFFIDMDGVLADFDKKVRESKRADEYLEYLRELEAWMKNHPDYEWKQPHDVKPLFSKDPQLKKIYKKLSNIVYSVAKKKDFFYELEPLPGGEKILKLAKDLTGSLPHILTACVQSDHCEPEKIEWMKRHYPGMYQDFFCEQKKGKYASSERDILVDDRKHNVEEFREAGGSIIHHDPKDVEATLREMKSLYDRLSK